MAPALRCADLRGKLGRIEEGDGFVAREHAQLLAVCPLKQEIVNLALFWPDLYACEPAQRECGDDNWQESQLPEVVRGCKP